eukprot:NODE_1673_length_2406_cov_7.585344.p1 GENE.NODE_1673_length_2406_cov_7.585344~~NODE_1673_length_2406_cov_7.585344.p1  ORF type:complete len:676 (-),score=192.74 NODE_1673_length_2406_cov_7.585344:317-2344(-)
MAEIAATSASLVFERPPPEVDGYPYRLCEYEFPVTVSELPEATTWFNRGLAWAYGYNHEEAARCFERAVKVDERCAMAWWGLGYTLGPNYNKPWVLFGDRAGQEVAVGVCRGAAQAAARIRDTSELAPLARELIAALELRYPSLEDAPAAGDDEAWTRWFAERASACDVAYAKAMGEIHKQHGMHADISALYAEACMQLSPWALFDWQHGGVARPGCLQALEAARTVLLSSINQRRSEGLHPHAGCSHFLIHLLEQSARPEDCLQTCDDLIEYLFKRGAGEGHLHHMPSHIYIQTGHYDKAWQVNHIATQAGAWYATDPTPGRGKLNFYSIYHAHDVHFEAWAAMFEGNFGHAIAAANKLIDLSGSGIFDRALLEINQVVGTYGEIGRQIGIVLGADMCEGFMVTKYHVLIRFGKWDDILAEDIAALAADALMLYNHATLRYARTVALAVKAREEPAMLERAEEEALEFEKAFLIMRDGAGKGRLILNNYCHNVLAVGRQLLLGELKYRRAVLAESVAEFETAFQHLRDAVRLYDGRCGGGLSWVSDAKLGIVYDEPWAWMMPSRHTLGALLLEHGKRTGSTAFILEARDVFCEDLGWGDTEKKEASKATVMVPRQLQHPNNIWALAGVDECLCALGQPDADVKARLQVVRPRADVDVKSACMCTAAASAAPCCA